MLIVYYSWSNGNTERVALELKKATGADIVRIDTAVPYQGSYDDVVEQGQREVKNCSSVYDKRRLAGSRH